MATSEAQEDAARQRIIKHMNADHQDSVGEQKAESFA
jgi:putative heme iron utilization protein